MASPTTQSTGNINQNERFYRYFKLEIAALRQQMSRLADTALVGGERIDATEHFIAGIARLSNEVKDAVVYIPAYDQRKYTEEIQALNTEFHTTRAAFAPKPKFSFKTQRKNASAISLADAEALASEQRLHIPGYDSQTPSSSAQSSLPPSPGPKPSTMIDNAMRSPGQAGKTGHGHGQAQGLRATDSPPPPSTSPGPFTASASASSSSSSNMSVSHHANKHLILPLPPSSPNAPPTTAKLSHLSHCVVDMSGTSSSTSSSTSTNTTPAEAPAPLPSIALTLTHISSSLLILPATAGPVHATALHDCVLVARCAQLRLHASAAVDCYLAVRGRPVLERCEGVRVAPLPGGVLGAEEVEAVGAGERDHVAGVGGDGDGDGDGEAAHDPANQWAQVDDFQWPRAGQSPHWCVLPPGERVAARVWREVVLPGGSALAGVEEILGAVGVGAGTGDRGGGEEGRGEVGKGAS